MESALQILADSLSRSTAFQSFVGVAADSDAAERIYTDILPAPEGDRYTEAELATLRPCALLNTGRCRYRRNATDGDCWEVQGELQIDLMRTTPDDEPGGLKDSSFRIIVESIVDYLKTVSYRAENLNAYSIETNGPFRTRPHETAGQGDYQEYQIMLSWGVE